MTATITITGLKELQKKLDPKRAERVLMAGMEGAANIIRNDLKTAPRRPTAAEGKAAFAAMSEKQRRWFFWALKKGKIEVPYRRGSSPGSEKLGASWTQKVRRAMRGIEAIIGSNASYGPWVMDKANQARIHQGRWPTVQDVAKRRTNDMQKLLETVLRKAIG